MNENKKYMLTIMIGVAVLFVLCVLFSLFLNLLRRDQQYISQPAGPTRTPNPTGIKEPGFYLVNSEIAPGLWRTTGDSDSCYWELNDNKNNILDNFYGMAGGTIYISPTAFELRLDAECGNIIRIDD